MRDDLLKEWADKVSSNKEGLDKEMFDEIIKRTIRQLKESGYEKTMSKLKEDCVKGKGNMMCGVILLRNNSKQIKDKLWGLNK